MCTRDGSIWTRQTRLAPSDSAVGDRLGGSVALTGDLALVGSARSEVGTNNDQGAAYVCGRTGSSWTQLSKLVAEDGAAGDGFAKAHQAQERGSSDSVVARLPGRVPSAMSRAARHGRC